MIDSLTPERRSFYELASQGRLHTSCLNCLYCNGTNKGGTTLFFGGTVFRMNPEVNVTLLQLNCPSLDPEDLDSK